MNNETGPRIMIRYVYFRINKLLQATREKERETEKRTQITGGRHKKYEENTLLKFYSD